MKAILIQPPFTQLNAPYPAIHNLEAFLRGRDIQAAAFDHSIGLYRKIFSRQGLSKVFSDARAALGKGLDAATKIQIDRYLSCEPLYIEWIDGIVDFLAGNDPAMAHRLASAVELPRGARAEAFLAERDGRIGPDEARSLATRILDDLGDFIAYSLDQAFGTVRYAERLASSRADFGEVRSALASSWLMNEFYAPMLDEFWSTRATEDLVLITIPFPGCLLGALACAQSLRRAFGETGRPRIVFGGGYVSTELRGLRDAGIFDFCDYLSFDAGYGSLASIMEGDDKALYRTMYRRGDGALVVAGFPEGDSARFEEGPRRVLAACVEGKRFEALEREAVKGVFPDYRSANFGDYLRIVDSENPMHRLWSDTPWLKYSLAHGCYWRRCSFCDTELEYVADFAPTKIEGLLAVADEASARTGLYGIHFVDEAMPMAALLEFARANRTRGAAGRMEGAPARRPFSYWGNVRFDAAWTQDRCEFLAASGLVAVSGGIEIATERGLAMTDKGFDLASLVRTLVAMRRAGLLVHAYLIYGFPGQPVADIVDSAEFCRQLFASGLVDSAFWHRFVLTRHSRMYREWRDGKRPELKPQDREWSFANNDLSFEGEKDYERFEAPLGAALAAWMEGAELEKPASAWFGRGISKASIAADCVESLIARAEETLDSEIPSPKGRAHWIAGRPIVTEVGQGSVAGKGASGLVWTYRGERCSIELPPAVAAETAAGLLSSTELSLSGMPYAELEARLGLPTPAMAELLSAGLVVV
ncbi:MAG: radical SAM protein [Spirochaetae bacterium HGW-Spirochaetae-9]|nr:MAG: radical SAM protein [Spirochaetae bacterium HGW-Spirochaetae-9]